MDPSIETINAQVLVEEAIIPAHPLEAPHVAQSEMVQSSEETATATETEDSSEKTE